VNVRVVEASIGCPCQVVLMITTLGRQQLDGVVARLDLHSDPQRI
jgi:hypothetical protein